MVAPLRTFPILALFAGLLLQATTGNAAVLYQDTFEPGDPADYIAVSTFGLPDVVVPGGAMTTNAARFNTQGNQPQFFYDQAKYDIPTGVAAISLEFDLMFSGFVGPSGTLFTLFLDAPLINTLQFRRNGLVTGPGPVTRAFTNDEVLHVSVLFDEIARRWTSSINGVPFSDFATFPQSGLDLRSVRFSFGYETGGNEAGPPRTNVYVDNVVISTVPLPGGLMLFTSAFAALAAGASKSARRRQ